MPKLNKATLDMAVHKMEPRDKGLLLCFLLGYCYDDDKFCHGVNAGLKVINSDQSIAANKELSA
jgi:hypothetical protein